MIDRECAVHNFETKCKEWFKEKYLPFREKKIILFGSAAKCEMMIKALSEIGMRENIVGITCNDPEQWGRCRNNIQIISPEEATKIEKSIFIICSKYVNEIASQLDNFEKEYVKSDRFDEWIERVLISDIYCTAPKAVIADAYNWIREFNPDKKQYLEKIADYFEDEESKDIINKRIAFYETGDIGFIRTIPWHVVQYFKPDYYGNTTLIDETYVDCGAYDGDSIKIFLSATKNCYNKIYAYEPDEDNYMKLKEMSEYVENLECYNMATGNINGYCKFVNTATSGSCISDIGTVDVKIVRLDDHIKENITFLKMDIEGAELDTLKGAEQLIKKCVPKLAICVYHKFSDLYLIPQFLKSIVPEYKFVLRQHDWSMYETVLYAWV